MDPQPTAFAHSTTESISCPQLGELPSSMRLLCIGPDQPSWVNLTLQLDTEGCHEPQFRWVSSGREALATLRDQSFDCILIDAEGKSSRLMGPFDRQATLNAVSLVQSVRSSGNDDPVILIVSRLDDSAWADTLRNDCDVIVTAHGWESRALAAGIKRAVERVELRRENHRLAVGNHRRLVREREEAEHLLSQQRQILGELSRLSPSATNVAEESSPRNDRANVELDASGSSAPVEPTWQRFSAEIADFYHELLRTYVIMGSGGLGNEIAKLAELIAFTGLKPREAMQLHLERVEALVRGLGSRSSRHVMSRADLMALELMIHLGECYQKQATSNAG